MKIDKTDKIEKVEKKTIEESISKSKKKAPIPKKKRLKKIF